MEKKDLTGKFLIDNEPQNLAFLPPHGSNERKFVIEAFDTNWVAPLEPNILKPFWELLIRSFPCHGFHQALICPS